MLNPAFSAKAALLINEDYVLPKQLADIVKTENASSDTTFEYRIQEVYTDEIWAKLNSLGYRESSLQDKTILDLCAGSGFLTYHLLKRVVPKEVILADISSTEINHAKKIISREYPNINVKYIVGDVLNLDYDEDIDIVIGNSFIHHLYDIPGALKQFQKYLKNSGSFISLHEPTLSALPLEAASSAGLVKRLIKGESYIGGYQFAGPGLVALPFSGDVWIFDSKDLIKLFEQAKFGDIRAQSWHLFRPYVTASNNLHLSKEKMQLNETEEKLLKSAIRKDQFLKKFLPSSVFGSISIAARK